MPTVLVVGTGNIRGRIASTLAEILSKRIKQINIERAIKESIEAHSNEIADLNTEQLNKGLKADGGTTGDYANIGYKGRLRPVDLYDTGDFHKSIHAKAFKKAFEIVATDEKTDKLQDRYGDDILGLTDQNVTEAGQIIKETLTNKVRKQL